MTTVLANATDQEHHQRVKEYYFWSAASRFVDGDELITIATLQAWKDCGEVCGPLSRDDFIRMVREQRIVDTTIIWEVWDGNRVWPYAQAEKLMLFRDVHRTVISSTKSPQSPFKLEPTDDASADELVASVLEEIQVELLSVRRSWLWRLPVLSWLLPFFARSTIVTAPPYSTTSDPNGGSSTEPRRLSDFTKRTKPPTDDVTAPVESSADSGFSVTSPISTIDDVGAPSTNELAGLLLSELEDASPTENAIGFAPVVRESAIDDSATVIRDFTSMNESLPDGRMHNAIEDALSHFDARAAHNRVNQTQANDAKSRLPDLLMRVLLRTGRTVLWPLRRLLILAETAVASEKTLVTGESFQRLDESLRRGLKHPLFLGVATAGVLVAIAFVIAAMQPDRPDELDFYAIHKLKETQDAIRAVRATQPDEQTWAEFSQTLTDELNVLKEALQKDMQTNRPVKEGLYLALEYRLPRILKEGRLKPSPAEGEFAARIQDAERQIKSAPQ